MRPPFLNRAIRGISRVELIGIVVILVVVLGISIPYWQSKAREAKRAQSAGNLRQWGIALNLFLVENQNRLPEPGNSQPGPDDTWAWYNTLPAYIAQRPLAELTPEEMRRHPVWNDPSAADDGGQEGYYFTYAMNRWLQTPVGSQALRIFDLEDPSSTVFMTETAAHRPGVLPQGVSFRHGPRRDPHPDARAHVLFCDGHVQIVNRAKLAEDPETYNPNAEKLSGLTWVPYFQAPQPPE